MKNAAAFGGFLGFLLVLGVGLTANRDAGRLFFDACVAALIGAFLMRWLMRVFLRGMHASMIARERAAKAEEQSDTTPNTETLNT